MAHYSVVVVVAESRREPCKMSNLTEIRATTSSHPKRPAQTRLGCTRFRSGGVFVFGGVSGGFSGHPA
jgi:hypothetical protein